MRLPDSVVAWMLLPKPSHPEFLNPVKSARQVLGAVWWPKDQKEFSLDLYWAFLSDRVQEMLNESENPPSSLSDLVSALDRVDLLWNEQEKLDEAGSVLVFENEPLKNYLLRLGVPGKLPRSLPQEDPRARRLIEGTSLEQWVNVLTARPVDDLR